MGKVWNFSWNIFSPIILSFVYIITIIPVNLIIRILNLDIIQKNFELKKQSYWQTHKDKKLTLGINSNVIFLKEFLAFMLKRKKFWLMPIILVLLIFGVLIVMTQGSAVAPFIYTIF